MTLLLLSPTGASELNLVKVSLPVGRIRVIGCYCKNRNDEITFYNNYLSFNNYEVISKWVFLYNVIEFHLIGPVPVNSPQYYKESL